MKGEHNDMMTLTDNFKAQGNNMESFAETMNELDLSTKTVNVDGSDIALLSLVKKSGNECSFRLISEDTIEYLTERKPLPGITVKNMDADLTDEMQWSCGFMMNIRHHLHFISPTVLSTLYKLIELPSAVMKEPSICRDLFLTDRLVWKENLNFLIREDETGYRKLFHIFGKNYVYQENRLMTDIAEALLKNEQFGKGVVRSWKTSHFLTNMKVEYPDAANKLKKKYHLQDKIIPGYTLYNSQTGESSFVLGFTLRKEGTEFPIMVTEASFEHSRKAIDPKDVLEAAVVDQDTMMTEIADLSQVLVSPVTLQEFPLMRKQLGSKAYTCAEKSITLHGFQTAYDMLMDLAAAMEADPTLTMVQEKWATKYLGTLPQQLMKAGDAKCK